ncbi:hypothetical protein F4V44_00335 [Niallia endozanthoxylica]|uniref:DUF5658 domain-containing protein n=1 Tax=Niallia endozanthoxylica TaxID=2036016 RepID=A0A5J5I8E9_9BACI|nr:hypothetical protein F4V44_00335 [Niallia endozanthoxylica]
MKHSFISELNPLMRQLYEFNPLLFILLKAALSLSLYLFIFLKKVPQSRWLMWITVLAAVFYTSVFALHCVWMGSILR